MTRSRRIAYVSGTRADFGLMQSTLQRMHASSLLELGIIATGMHLDAAYGYTIGEIESAGLPIIARLPVEHGQSMGADIARSIAVQITGLVDALASFAPDGLLVLGDRGEMLAAAIAGGHMSIPVLHIHGGERSGTVDEPVRHAISKLSHFHLVATNESLERLIRMGEDPDTIRVVGAPGLDGLVDLASHEKHELFSELGLDSSKKTALLVYHPVLQEAAEAGGQIESVLDALLGSGFAVLALKPNSDAGSAGIRTVLEHYAESGQIRLFTHLPRDEFASMLRHADVLVGNSSSGIIEAASFGTHVVNIGSRQNLRQRNANVIDVPADSSAIVAALNKAGSTARMAPVNIYGDGGAGARIVDLLETIELPGQLMAKANAY